MFFILFSVDSVAKKLEIFGGVCFAIDNSDPIGSSDIKIPCPELLGKTTVTESEVIVFHTKQFVLGIDLPQGL